MAVKNIAEPKVICTLEMKQSFFGDAHISYEVLQFPTTLKICLLFKEVGCSFKFNGPLDETISKTQQLANEYMKVFQRFSPKGYKVSADDLVEQIQRADMKKGIDFSTLLDIFQKSFPVDPAEYKASVSQGTK